MATETLRYKFVESGLNSLRRSVGNLGQDLDDVAQGADDAGQSLGDMSDKANETGSSFEGMSSRLKGVGTAIAASVAAVGTALGAITSKTSRYADQVDRAVEQTGMTAQSIQEFASVAQRTANVDFSTIRDGLKELSARSAEAAEGTGEAKEAFERLGISQKEIANSTPTELFSRVRKEMRGLTAAQRTLTTEQIFGDEAGQKLARTLGLSAEEYARLTDRAKESGNVLSGSQLQALQDVRSGYRNLKQDVLGTARQLGASLAPVINNAVIPAIQNLTDFVSDVITKWQGLSGTTKTLITLIPGLITGFYGLTSAVSAVTTVVAALKNGYIAMKAQAVSAWLASVAPVAGVVAGIGAVGASVALIYDNWDGLTDFFKSLWDSVQNITSAFADVMKYSFVALWEKIKQIFIAGINKVLGVYNSALETLGLEGQTVNLIDFDGSGLENAKDNLQDSINEMQNAGTELGNEFEGSMSDAWAAIKDSTMDAVKELRDMLGFGQTSKPENNQEESSSGSSSRSIANDSNFDAQAAGLTNPMGDTSNLQGIMPSKKAEERIRRLKRQLRPMKFIMRDMGAIGKNALGSLSNGLGQVIAQVLTLDKSISSLGDVFKKMKNVVVQVLQQIISKLASAAIIAAALAPFTGGGSFGSIFSGALSGGVGGGFDAATQSASSVRSGPPTVSLNVSGQSRLSGEDIVTSYNVTQRNQRRKGRL